VVFVLAVKPQLPIAILEILGPLSSLSANATPPLVFFGSGFWDREIVFSLLALPACSFHFPLPV